MVRMVDAPADQVASLNGIAVEHERSESPAEKNYQPERLNPPRPEELDLLEDLLEDLLQPPDDLPPPLRIERLLELRRCAARRRRSAARRWAACRVITAVSAIAMALRTL